MLGYLDSGNEVKFEEVIYLDAKNQFLATYEGTELTYDYCVLAQGKQVDFSQIEGFKESLSDEFSFVVCSYDFKNAKKMQQRLDFAYGNKIIVYHAGHSSFNW